MKTMHQKSTLTARGACTQHVVRARSSPDTAQRLAARAGLARDGSAHTRPVRGFTLLELLVTVAAIAVVSLGLAAVFQSVGKAVTTGRRVSRFNQYGRLIEERMRKDFGAITTDGFLVIRQQYADVNADGVFVPADDTVPLSPQDTTARPRRIDEIVFFARGQYEPQRLPLPAVEWHAHVPDARIYYGHGMKAKGTDPADPRYANPWVNSAPTGTPTQNLGQIDGVNRYAGQWTLLRQSALLASMPTPGTVPGSPVLGLDPAVASDASVLVDRICQVKGMPAAASIFRSVNGVVGPGTPSALGQAPTIDQYMWYVSGTNENYNAAGGFAGPIFASGLVDMATTSLADVRLLMMGGGNGSVPRRYNPMSVRPAQYGLSSIQTTRPATAESLDVQQAWMDNAFPAPAAGAYGTPPYVGPSPEPATGTRIRCEDRAVGLLEAIANPPASPREAFFMRSDRQMLTAFTIAPACTEFVVEWSFGQVDASNQMIWHGPRRKRQGAPAAEPPVADFYPPATGGVSLPVPRINGTTGAWAVTPRLVYGQDAPASDELCLTSYFGFNDPLFNPDANGDGMLSENAPPQAPTNDAAVASVPWVWPRLIRVRVTLTDPTDPAPGTEQTFEFIFTIAESNAG